jgi:hypothetical protein
LIPPRNIEAPSASRRLPMIEPDSDALTALTSPFCSAKKPMMISGALPIEALRSPPRVGPRYVARASVASRVRAARGIKASADVARTISGSAPYPCRAIATGMNRSNQFSFRPLEASRSPSRTFQIPHGPRGPSSDFRGCRGYLGSG